MTGVPVKKVIRSEAKYLLNLEKTLGKYVIGHRETSVPGASCRDVAST